MLAVLQYDRSIFTFYRCLLYKHKVNYHCTTTKDEELRGSALALLSVYLVPSLRSTYFK